MLISYNTILQTTLTAETAAKVDRVLFVLVCKYIYIYSLQYNMFKHFLKHVLPLIHHGSCWVLSTPVCVVQKLS